MRKIQKKLTIIAKTSNWYILSPITNQARTAVHIGVVFVITCFSIKGIMPNAYVAAVKATTPNSDLEKSLNLYPSCTTKPSFMQ